jgi:hypothetical protein
MPQAVTFRAVGAFKTMAQCTVASKGAKYIIAVQTVSLSFGLSDHRAKPTVFKTNYSL